MPKVHARPRRYVSVPDTERALYGLEMVYYVRHLGHVKIGHTTSIMMRLRTLRVKPTDLLAWEPGGAALERKRHEEFAASNVRGDGLGREHFAATPDLMGHIAHVRAHMVQRAGRNVA